MNSSVYKYFVNTTYSKFKRMILSSVRKKLGSVDIYIKRYHILNTQPLSRFPRLLSLAAHLFVQWCFADFNKHCKLHDVVGLIVQKWTQKEQNLCMVKSLHKHVLVWSLMFCLKNISTNKNIILKETCQGWKYSITKSYLVILLTWIQVYFAPLPFLIIFISSLKLTKTFKLASQPTLHDSPVSQ